MIPVANPSPGTCPALTAPWNFDENDWILLTDEGEALETVEAIDLGEDDD